MFRNIENLFRVVFDYYIATCAFLAFFIMTLIGVGDVPITSMAGFFVCTAGFVRKSAKVDLWVFIPMVLYVAAVTASSYAAYGNIIDGYGGIHLIFPVIYLLTACMDSREFSLLRQMCVIWVGISAAVGVVKFTADAVFYGKAGRLDGILGNPNATGIFLVMGWFALLRCLEEDGKETDGLLLRTCKLHYLEPILFLALALTMSLGSYASMSMGILLLIWSKYRTSRQEAFQYACQMLAKVVLGTGTGILLYMGAVRTNVPWVCILILLYSVVLIMFWKDFGYFLKVHAWIAVGIAGSGILVAVLIITIRSGAFATFSERLDMMHAALQYLTVDPFLGVGPYQWRLLDMQDGGKYFATWHIHNILIHAGVEFGWIAAAMLAAIAVRFYRKDKDTCTKAGFTAYCLHNMMDTSFFYVGITSLSLIMSGQSRSQGKKIGNIGVKALFGLFAMMHTVYFVCYLMT